MSKSAKVVLVWFKPRAFVFTSGICALAGGFDRVYQNLTLHIVVVDATPTAIASAGILADPQAALPRLLAPTGGNSVLDLLAECESKERKRQDHSFEHGASIS
jgi:hypothetical protein